MLSKQEKDIIVDMYLQGNSIHEIKRKTRHGRNIIKNVLVENNVPTRPLNFVQINWETNNTKSCKVCGKSFSFKKRNNKFCSHSCSATYSNIHRYANKNKTDSETRLKKLKLKKEIKQKYCKQCGNEISKRNSRFCSSNCHNKYKWDQCKKQIENREYVSERRIKKYLVEKNKDTCSICGISEWMGEKLVKILDHIDGNNQNSDINNLRIICSNCDSQLSTYKAKNKGKGRLWRKEWEAQKSKRIFEAEDQINKNTGIA